MENNELFDLGFLQPQKRSNSYSVSKQMQSSDLKDRNVEDQEPLLKCRYIVTFVGFWTFVLISIFRIQTSVNIIAMVNQSAVANRTKVLSDSCPNLLPNLTFLEFEQSSVYREDGEFIWSPKVQGYILSSFFVGYIISVALTGRMVEIYGGKWFLCWSFFLMAVCTILMPPVAWISVYALIVLQFLRGFSMGVFPNALSVLAINWFTRTERGQFYTIMFCGYPLGSCFGSLLSGYLCASVGKWPSSFYTTGAIGLMVSLLVLFLIHESPKDHPRISKAELDFILSDQECTMAKRRPNPPWRQILTSAPVYALIFARFGYIWSLSQFYIVQAIFLETILHYPIEENGSFIAIIHVVQFVVSLITIPLSTLMTKKRIASLDFTRKFWIFLAALGFSCCMIGIYFAGCNRTPSIILAALSMGFLGFAIPGCNVAHADLSPTFSGTLNGFSLGFAFMTSVIIPVVVGYLTDEMQTIEQWNKFFFISIGVVMTCGTIFVVFGSAEVQPWNYVKEENGQATRI